MLVDPLPLVPATWSTGYVRCGFSSASSSASVRSSPNLKPLVVRAKSMRRARVSLEKGIKPFAREAHWRRRVERRAVGLQGRVVDAIALAVRAKVPIYADEAVLDRAGVMLDKDGAWRSAGSFMRPISFETALRSALSASS